MALPALMPAAEVTAAFPHAAIAGGWSPYGPPACALDGAAGAMRCGQAAAGEVAPDDPDARLAEL